MKPIFRNRALRMIVLLIVLSALSACSKPATLDAAAARSTDSPTAASGIAWREGDVEDAFAEARENGKPVLLYWGAAWCPPCSRLKETLFKDPSFIESTREFVAVHLDGDSEGTQTWGERFGVIGYPTIILARPDRTEITRLTGDADNAHLAAAMRTVANSNSTFKQVLDKAMRSPTELSLDGWTLLQTYAWNADEQLANAGNAADILARLSKVAPNPALQRHFALAALSEEAELSAGAQAYRTLFDQLLADPEEVRANAAVMPYAAARLVLLASTNADDREVLSSRMESAVDRLYADTTLPVVDRLSITRVRIQLARLAQGQSLDAPTKDLPPLPIGTMDEVRRRVKWAIDVTAADKEREAVIESAAFLLREAGDNSGAEQLLISELVRSKVSYFYMDYLARLAEERGDRIRALSWFKRAYETSEGQGTRARLGTSYINGMLRLSPRDATGIEDVTMQVVSELMEQSGWYDERDRKRLNKLGESLRAWSQKHPLEGNAVLERLHKRLTAACRSETKSECTGWLD